MKISVFGTTLQAGVLAGLMAEFGHQVSWCLHSQKTLNYQDEHVNLLIKHQIQLGFLNIVDVDHLNLDQDVYLFSFTPTEVDIALNIAKKISLSAIIHPKLMINGSTFGLQGTQQLKSILSNDYWAYLPDVIQEGNAIQSFTQLKQVIVGVDQAESEQLMSELLRPIFQLRHQFLFMPILDAEFTKLSISGMLATRISYMNDLAVVSEKLGIDISNVRQGLAADTRIGATYLSPGAGFGGENFSHDILTLSNTVADLGVHSHLLEQVWAINEQQKEVLFRKLWNYYHSHLQGKTVAIWGASFKENTSSIQNAPIHVMLQALWAQGVIVKLHDPQALKEIENMYGTRADLILCKDQYEAVEQADALCLMTAWAQYWSPDYLKLKQKMQHPLILDGRNIYDPAYVKSQGFAYQGVGRS